LKLLAKQADPTAGKPAEAGHGCVGGKGAAELHGKSTENIKSHG
jgi:hypothetical protein